MKKIPCIIFMSKAKLFQIQKGKIESLKEGLIKVEPFNP